MLAHAKHLVLAAAILVGAAFPVTAETPEQSIERQLRAQGYTQINVTRTLLGRMRFAASAGATRREIIFNPRTGEILRDYSETTGMGAEGPNILQPDANAVVHEENTTQESSSSSIAADHELEKDDKGDDRSGSSGESDDDSEGDGDGHSDGHSEGDGDGDGEGDGDGDGD